MRVTGKALRSPTEKKSSTRMDYSSFSAVSILRLVDFDNQNEVSEKTHIFFPLETSQKVWLAADLDRFKQFPELLRIPKIRTAFREFTKSGHDYPIESVFVSIRQKGMETVECRSGADQRSLSRLKTPTLFQLVERFSCPRSHPTIANKVNSDR